MANPRAPSWQLRRTTSPMVFSSNSCQRTSARRRAKFLDAITSCPQGRGAQ